MGSTEGRSTGGFFVTRLRSFGHAFRGLGRLSREPHARIHALATVLVLGLGSRLGLAALEWTALVFAIGLVFSAEAFNTALESLADASVPERHPLVGAAKDLAAGGVLVAALAAAVVGMLVLGPHLWEACQRFR